MPEIGHNSQPGGIAADQLTSYIKRIERLEEEKANIQADIKEVYGEAKALGYDVKTMRQVIKRRKIEKDKRDEQDALLHVYESIFD
jgi:uncharacterized protein (UPF0335 family)